MLAKYERKVLKGNKKMGEYTRAEMSRYFRRIYFVNLIPHLYGFRNEEAFLKAWARSNAGIVKGAPRAMQRELIQKSLDEVKPLYQKEMEELQKVVIGYRWRTLEKKGTTALDIYNNYTCHKKAAYVCEQVKILYDGLLFKAFETEISYFEKEEVKNSKFLILVPS